MGELDQTTPFALGTTNKENNISFSMPKKTERRNMLNFSLQSAETMAKIEQFKDVNFSLIELMKKSSISHPRS